MAWYMGKRGNRSRRVWKKQWLDRRARRLFLNPRHKYYRPVTERWGTANVYTRRSIRRVGEAAVELSLPPHLDLEENFESTLSHFRHVRDAALGRYRIRRLGFEKIVEISPAAALILASEVDQWKQRAPRLRADVDSWNPEVRRRLCQMGYFELLKLPKPPTPPDSGDLIFLRFLRGTSEPDDKGKLAKQLRVNIEAIVGQGVVRRHVLFDSLSEAITNVIHHAYPDMSADSAQKPWWLSASFDRRYRELTVLIYDQGVGIPATLPARWAHYEKVKDVFGKWTDSQKIEAATTYGRSSTNRPERGKGLVNLQSFAKAYQAGRLSIYSRYGMYRLLHGNGDAIETVRRDHRVSVGGTLIEWSVRL